MTVFENDVKVLECAYLVYQFLHSFDSMMRVEPILSEAQFIRKVISGWPRERAIQLYKHLYLKDLLALREEKKSAFDSELENALIRRARFSRDIDIRKPTLATILADDINRFWLDERVLLS